MEESILWAKVGAIGQVAGAFATFLAVCVSLWLARSERRVNVKARAGLSVLVAGDGSPFEDIISIQIANHGFQPIRVSSIGWRTGWWRYWPKWLKFQYAIQKLDLPVSGMSGPRPPFDLGPRQEVSIHIPPDPFKNEGDLRDDFFNRHFPWKRECSPTKICIVVYVVASKAVITRVERDLEDFLASGKITGGAQKLNDAAEAKRGGTNV